MARKQKTQPDASKEGAEVPPLKPSIAVEPGPKKVKITPEELKRLQAEGKLIGWNPATGEALIK
jgi:hypothetical protein